MFLFFFSVVVVRNLILIGRIECGKWNENELKKN